MVKKRFLIFSALLCPRSNPAACTSRVAGIRALFAGTTGAARRPDCGAANDGKTGGMCEKIFL